LHFGIIACHLSEDDVFGDDPDLSHTGHPLGIGE